VKSAARQWGGEGITVETLAIDDGSDALGSRWAPAIDPLTCELTSLHCSRSSLVV
jgi:hypothetical protein